MKALLKMEAGNPELGYRDLDEPSPAEGQVKIRVSFAGICGSDLHIMHDEYPSRPPVVMGHEYSGTIAELGRGVEGWAVGDRVVSLTAAVTCGKCDYCRQGLLMLCAERRSIGSGVNGAFEEYFTISSDLLFRIPDGVSMEEAALSEPLACTVRAVIERGKVAPGDRVYVSGPGVIGQLTMQVALACGASVVMGGTSADAERLKLAKECGASAVVAVDAEDGIARAAELTGGKGFDVAFECSGAAASLDLCLRILKKTGYLGQVGLYGKKVPIDMDLALMKEINFTNSFAQERTSWVTALRLLAEKRVNLKPLYGPILPLAEWRRGFDLLQSKQGYKILLKP